MRHESTIYFAWRQWRIWRSCLQRQVNSRGPRERNAAYPPHYQSSRCNNVPCGVFDHYSTFCPDCRTLLRNIKHAALHVSTSYNLTAEHTGGGGRESQPPWRGGGRGAFELANSVPSPQLSRQTQILAHLEVILMCDVQMCRNSWSKKESEDRYGTGDRQMANHW